MNTPNYADRPREEKKEILFENLDVKSIEWRPYRCFIILYLFNATIALPVFTIKLLYLYVEQIVKNIRFFRVVQCLKAIIFFICDLAMTLSILMMYILVGLRYKQTINYEDWAISCLLFLQSQILMSSYVLTISIDRKEIDFDFLISAANMSKLGLGRLYQKLLHQNLSLDKQEELKQENLYNQIRNAMETENIDSTLYYIALESDPGICTIDDIISLSDHSIIELIERARKILSTQHDISFDRKQFEQPINKLKILKELRVLGFRGYRHAIDNFLWPHYDYIKVKQEKEPASILLIYLIVLIAKGSFPLYLLSSTNNALDIEYLFFGCFLGMYLNMIILLIDLIKCNDIKGKRYILNVLQTMIIPNKAQDQIEDENDSGKDEIPDDLPYNSDFKLDFSCNLSLESWDNMRRLTLLIDNEWMDYNEAQIAFVFLYFVYLYMNLSSVFLDFDLIPILHSFFQDPILEWNMIVDFTCLALLFLNRVYQGTLYNQTFENIIESIKKIETVYDDKKALFDFYFSSNLMENIQNETYRKITQKIYCSACDKVIYTLASKGMQELPLLEFLMLAKSQAKQRVFQLCATMKKVKDQIEFDNDNYSHKMLGIYRSNIWTVISTFGFLGYIFFRGKIKGYLNKHKAKQL
ncbi:unnamed protein product [Paramecium pentaurelia]|uniref:Uncharacterized protein n=1 Tax=Paramecium pentaurelia TaxID=43138 RepID=A0A8S1SZH8_9CILI|nr:unnamed protein product [Paramecium pentaurelia]